VAGQEKKNEMIKSCLLVVLMYYLDNKKHRQPHVHVQYSGDEAVISIPDGAVLEGRSEPLN
jgi:Domain of unknown function (DUF4160)